MEFRILFGLVNEFQSKLDKLNEKCVKYGNSILSFTIIETFEDEYIKNQIWAKIDLQGCVPKVGNYELIGVISKVEDKHLIKCVPGKQVPETYRSNQFYCDHCHINRYRAEVVVVQDTVTQEYKQLGKQCLKDYLGISLENLVNQFTWINDLIEDCQNYDRCPKSQLVVSPEHYLIQVAIAVRKFGYVSTAKSYDSDTMSTKSIAWNIVYPYPRFIKDWIDHYELYEEEQDKLLANNALEWAKHLVGTNNFENNIKVLANCQHVEYKNCGYLAAIIPCYQKFIGDIKEKAKIVRKESNWIGEIKKRMELNVKCVFTKVFDSQYGDKTLVKFVDSEENVLTWFASGLVDFEPEQSYNIKFTVTKHEVYQDKKQTIVNRVKNLIQK